MPSNKHKFTNAYVSFISRVHRSRLEEPVQSKSITLERTGMTHWRFKKTLKLWKRFQFGVQGSYVNLKGQSVCASLHALIPSKGFSGKKNKKNFAASQINNQKNNSVVVKWFHLDQYETDDVILVHSGIKTPDQDFNT